MSSFAQLKKQREGRTALTSNHAAQNQHRSAPRDERGIDSSFSSSIPPVQVARSTQVDQDVQDGLGSAQAQAASTQPPLTVAEHQRQIAAALDAAARNKPDPFSPSAQAPFNPFVDRWTSQPVRAPLYSPPSGSRSPSPAMSSSSSSSIEAIAAQAELRAGQTRMESSAQASTSAQPLASQGPPRSRSPSPKNDPVIPPRPYDGNAVLRQAYGAERRKSVESVDEATSRRLNEIFQLGPHDGVEVKAGISGRGLYATKTFRPGSVILARPPVIKVLSTSDLVERCSHCLLTPHEAAMLHTTEERPLFPCKECKVVHYCSPHCKDADMAVHTYECRALRRAKTADPTSPTPPDSLRALARLGWTYHLLRDRGQEGEQLARQIRRLEHHLHKEERGSPELNAALEAHTKQCMRVARSLVSFMTLGLPTDDAEQAQKEVLGIFSPEYAGSLLALVSAWFTINTFSASSPSLDIIGAALNPVMAMSNHSCDPNAVVVFPEGAQSMRIVAIKPIQTGEEVLTHYIDIAQPRSARQSDLLETYHFTCRCTLCSKDFGDPYSAYEADARSALYHATCSVSPKGLLSFKWERAGERVQASMYPHASCTACAEPWAGDGWPQLMALLNRGQQVLQQDAKGELSDDALSELYTSIIPSLSTFMPPSSWPLLPLLRLTARCTPKDTPADVRRAVGYYEQYCLGAKDVYTYGHPAAAIVAAEMAKTCALPCEGTDVGEGLKRSLRVLGEAVKQCEVGFGTGGGLVGKEMRWLGDMCRGELAKLGLGSG